MDITDATVSTDPVNQYDGLAAFAIISLVGMASVFVEFLSWFFVYRTADYKRLIHEIDGNCRKVAELKRTLASDKDAAKKKKKLDDSLLKTSQEFSTLVRFKTGALTMVTMMVLYRFITTFYAGVVVARLPFSPPAFMQRVTHSSLAGDDATECSALFIYVLCGMAVRGNVTKFLNLGPSRAITKATLPQNVADKSKWE